MAKDKNKNEFHAGVLERQDSAAGTPGRYRVKHVEHGAYVIDGATSEKDAKLKWLRERFPSASEDAEWVRVQTTFNMRAARLPDSQTSAA